MLERSGVLTREIGPSPRRGVLRALATVGVGSVLGGLSAPSADAKKKGKNKNKNKDKTTDRCPKPPICPEGCPLLYTLAEGTRVCGAGTVDAICPSERCFSSEQCLVTQQKVHCMVEIEDLEIGDGSRPHACPGSLPGICGTVAACTV